MASGQEIHINDLPPELKDNEENAQSSNDWESCLRTWVNQSLARGEHDILDDALPKFEKIMIEVALKKTGGRRQNAAKLLGWGRNTLTRKIKELELKL